MSDKYTAEQFLSIKRNTAGGCYLTKTEADQLGEMMEQAAQMMREREVGGEVAWMMACKGRPTEFYETKPDFVPPISRLFPLYTAPRAAVPDGWKLVPIEPTKKMLLSHEQLIEFSSGEEGELEISIAYDAYKAMLAAAPEVTK